MKFNLVHFQMIDFVNIENVPLVTKMVYVAYSHEDNVKRRQCYLLKILDKRFAGINLVHLKRSRGPSPPQAARRKASAVSPFAQRLILKLNFTFQRSGRGVQGVFENMI